VKSRPSTSLSPSLSPCSCGRPQFDLAVVDPPTFSNTKRPIDDWGIQQDHAELIDADFSVLRPGDVLYFSTNSRRFKFDEHPIAAAGAQVRNITRQTIPEDFRNQLIHQAWRVVKS
jgi:23S rRNA G2069 N7-methylase RlmK/C1962 C5-methylase RlmI